MKSRYSMQCIVLLCSSAVALAQAQNGQELPTAVGSCVVKEVEGVTARRFTGQLEAIDSVAIVAQVAGEIKEVCFADGQIVEKGAPLYKLDDVKYMAAQKAAEAAVAQCKANLDYAEKTFNRTKTLYERKVASSDDMDSATSAFDTAKAALASAEANLMLASDNLSHATVTAPVSGKIGVNKATVGNYVALSSGALTTIVSSNPIRLKFSISNRDFMEMFQTLENLVDDSEVKLRLADGTDYGSTGNVAFTDNAANPLTDSLTVYAEFANPEGALIPSSMVSLELRRKTAYKTFSVSPAAIVRDSAGAFVYVIGPDNRAEKRMVVTGANTGDAQHVKEGLKAGESVVSKGTHKVRPGILLDPRPEE